MSRIAGNPCKYWIGVATLSNISWIRNHRNGVKMQKIHIKNFGPIKDFKSDIDDFSFVFIGPQASGKSTISKAIYFFKSLRDDLFRFVIEAIERNDTAKLEIAENNKKFLPPAISIYTGSIIEKFRPVQAG